MNVLLVSDKRTIRFPKVNGVESIRSVKTYKSERDRIYETDVIVTDESVDPATIELIRADFEESIIVGTGLDKKYKLDFGTNAYLQKPYTQEQLFQAIALGGLTHYLLVTFPLDIKDKMAKKNIYCF